MKRLFDLDHPFFRPLWIRVATVAFCTGWGALEAWWGNPIWASLFWALAAYCAWGFFIDFNPRERDKDDR